MTSSPPRFPQDAVKPIKEQMSELYSRVAARDPDQNEFLQAFKEVMDSLEPVFTRCPKYLGILETLAEPERVISFRVPWMDDKGVQRVNRGFRVQYSSILGPYKGGLRLHPTVNLSVLKFLGFEQCIKNALTTLPMGGAKGGSDFDPKDKTENEVMRFCQSFMTELHRHIGANTDVPAGDINVGGREIGYMYGQYRRLTNLVDGTLTGKGLSWGGSLIRSEATGYGAVYFAESWCKDNDISLSGARCCVSGSGNVAQYTVEKLLHVGAVPVTMSDSSGYIYEPTGFTHEQLQIVKNIKNVERLRITEYLKHSTTAVFFSNLKPWGAPNCKVAFPSATQNEINESDAELLKTNGCVLVVEGANMPSTTEAIEFYRKAGIAFCPGKAANAGGVAVSGLEMAQNSSRLSWTSNEVDQRLKDIMTKIYQSSKDAALEYGIPGNIQAGANIAGFLKLADAIVDQGCV